MAKVKNLKDLSKNKLNKIRKGVLAAMNSTDIQQPIVVNDG